LSPAPHSTAQPHTSPASSASLRFAPDDRLQRGTFGPSGSRRYAPATSCGLLVPVSGRSQAHATAIRRL